MNAKHNIDLLPRMIQGGEWNTGHVQGIAIDTARQYMYFSFTRALVKTDMAGNLIGTVTGLTGHLGDLDFNDEDGRVYGSLEYKAKTAFYIAIFDVDKIDRVGMDAEKDGIMTTVYLPEVVEDFTEDLDGDGIVDKDDGTFSSSDVSLSPDHRYGCSGIDGTAFGPAFGEAVDTPHQLMIAYGIYGNVSRGDNDYQIILQFDWRKFGPYEKPLKQDEPHREGIYADKRYFVFTGNTTYGVQNLEYDGNTGNWLMAVYRGKKEQYPNYPLYIIDGHVKPVMGEICGQKEPEQGLLLSLTKEGVLHEASGVRGWTFKWGQTGLIALDDGYFYISHNYRTEEKLQGSHVHLYRWTGEAPEGFVSVE